MLLVSLDLSVSIIRLFINGELPTSQLGANQNPIGSPLLLVVFCLLQIAHNLTITSRNSFEVILQLWLDCCSLISSLLRVFNLWILVV